MKTHRMTQRTTVLAALLLALGAAPTHAAEGDLEIFPDLFLGARPFASHYVHLMALFLLMIAPVNRIVLKPLLRVLDERSAKIEGARKRAGEISAQAEVVLAQYERAVEGARKQAEELRKGELDRARGEQARLLAEARQRAESEVAGARSGIAGALAGARAELRGGTEALAREAAARVLGRSLS